MLTRMERTLVLETIVDGTTGPDTVSSGPDVDTDTRIADTDTDDDGYHNTFQNQKTDEDSLISNDQTNPVREYSIQKKGTKKDKFLTVDFKSGVTVQS